MKKIILIALVLILGIIFLIKPSYDFFALNQTFIKSKVIIVNVVGMTLLSLIFGCLGHRQAGQYGFSKFKWTFICILFNVWGYIYLKHKTKNRQPV